MKNTTRFFVIGCTALFFCIVSAYGGYYAGYERALRVAAMNIVISNALSHLTAFSLLERMDIDGTKEQLYSMLNSEIMQLYVLQGNAPNAELKRDGLKTLTRIAKHRQEFPFSRKHSIPEVDQRVKDILDSVSNEKRKDQREKEEKE